MTQPNNIDQLLEAMVQDPQRVGELRRALLTQELLRLPDTVAQLAESTAAIADGVKGITRQLLEIQQTVASQGGHIANLEGRTYQGHVARHGLGPIRNALHLDSIRLLCNNDRDDGAALQSLLETRKNNTLKQEDLEELLRTDLIFTGTACGQETFILVETSRTAKEEDFRRATRRAAILRRATGIPTIAVAAGSGLDPAVGPEADSQGYAEPGQCTFIRVAHSKP